MNTISITEARKNLYGLCEETRTNHHPVTITAKRGNVVLLSEEDWTAICETIYLNNIPNMASSIQEGMATPALDCEKVLDW